MFGWVESMLAVSELVSVHIMLPEKGMSASLSHLWLGNKVEEFILHFNLVVLHSELKT